jgi:adenylate cyclase
MLTFRIAITAAVLAFITALTACLIFIQLATFHAAASAAAAAAMDAASANTLSRLEADVTELSSLVRVLSTNPSLAATDDRSEEDDAIVLFKAALNELPQADSLYVGYDNGCWLQVRRLDVLGPTERQKLKAPPGAVYNVNLVRPTAGGTLPMRRIFEDQQGKQIGRLDLPNYGYDARDRVWYRDTMQTDRPVVSSPYASFSIGTPMITLSAPLHGHVSGVIAADLKLDKFSDLVYAQRPGEHGTAVIFDSFGALIAHRDFARLATSARTNPSQPRLPDVREIRSGLVGAVMRRWNGGDHFAGSIRDDDGRDYFFRLQKFSQKAEFSGYSLLLAAEDDFAPNVRKLQKRGIVIALIAGCCFVPAVWVFGSRMSNSLKRITAQASRLRTLAAPNDAPVTSRVAEIYELGRTIAVAQRSIWSFSRFVPKDIVKGIIDSSISTELGGVRQEVTILFHRRHKFHRHCRGCRPRQFDAPDIAPFFRSDRRLSCRGRDCGQVHRGLGDGVLERAPPAARSCRTSLSRRPLGQDRKRGAEHSICSRRVAAIRRSGWYSFRRCGGGKRGLGGAHELHGARQ